MQSFDTSPDFIERLVIELGLTDDQAAQVDQALKRAVLERRAARARFGHIDSTLVRNNLEIIAKRADQELMALLTKNQFAKFLAYRNRMRQSFLDSVPKH